MAEQKFRLTPLGGMVIRLTNKTGAASVVGTILETSDTTDDAVKLAVIGAVDPMGIMYSGGVADGGQVWVVIGGIADVLYSTAVVLDTIARMAHSGDATKTAGYAISEAIPTSPFAVDKHFQEIGHPIEARGNAGLARTVIHFN